MSKAMAWLYKDDPTFDGNKWVEKKSATTSEQLAKYKDKDCAPLYTTDHAEELAKALEPFAKYACDDETDPNHCYNCEARAVLTNYREATK